MKTKNVKISIVTIAACIVCVALFYYAKQSSENIGSNALTSRVKSLHLASTTQASAEADKQLVGSDVAGAQGEDKQGAGVSLSSYLNTSILETMELTNEQLAVLEVELQKLHARVYKQLVESAEVSVIDDTRIKLHMPADEQNAERGKQELLDVLANVLGNENALRIVDDSGMALDARFAYFGRYDMDMNVSYDSINVDKVRYISVETEYASRAPMVMKKSLSILKKKNFENDYYSLGEIINVAKES